MTSNVVRIDWRREFDRLAPHLRKGRAVVRIDHHGEISAWNRFDARLKQEFAEAPGSAMSVRISAHWHTTRFLADILGEFDRKLAAAGLPRVVLAQAGNASVRVVTDNTFEGASDIRIDQLHMHAPSPAQQTAERNGWVASVCDRIGTVLDRGDRVMVVLHHARHTEQIPFWRDFWQRGLQDLVDRGMLFIYYVENDEAAYDSPAGQLHFTLPRDFSDDSREGEAYDDMIDLMTGLDVGPQMAAGLAISHLNSNKDAMNKFYNNLVPLIMKVQTLAASSAE